MIPILRSNWLADCTRLGLTAGIAATALNFHALPSLGQTTTTTTTTTTTSTSPPIVIVPPVPPRPRPPHPPHPDWTAPVTLTSVRANITIDEQVAATSIEMVLTNPAGRQQEAEVMLPVPDGVAVRSFEYDGVGPEPTAKLLPKEEARRIYDSIVNRQRDPGLLEFVGYNMIKSSVFPIPAGGSRTVRLVIEQVLTADANRIDYWLPRSESTAARSGDAGPAPWTITASIKSKRGISTVYSPSHEIVTERINPTHVNVKIAQSSSSAAGSFRLSYLLDKPGDDGITTTVLAYPDPSVGDGTGGYFLLLGGLPATPRPDQAIKREIVMVIDRSGSMRGPKLEQARQAALQVIDGLEMGEAFNIIDFSDSTQSFADKPIVKTKDTADSARKYIQALQAGGGTALHDALIEALRPAPTQGMLPMVLFLTDGLPTVGEKSEVKIREDAKKVNSAERRVFTFGVGFDVNGPLLTNLARSSRGAPTFVLPEEDVEVKVSQVFRRLSGPVLAAPKLALAGDGGPRRIRELQAGGGGAEIPDLFDGDQLVILGEYSGADPIHLTLDGNYLGKARHFAFDFDPKSASTRNAYVPRLWASRKIAALLDEIRQSGASGNAAHDPKTKELVDEIVRLSTRYGILTEYTAFLATEPDHYARGDAGRPAGGAQPTPLPSLSAAPAAARREMGKLADDRAGRAGVAQDMNVQQQVASKTLDTANCFVDADMKVVRLNGVQQVNDVTCFNRAGRWVDARILDKEQEKPDRTVEFGTEEYSKCLDQLVQENRQGLLAFPGDVYILLNNQRVLFRNPE